MIHTFIIFQFLCFSDTFLSDNNAMLVGAASEGIGLLGKTLSLPMPAEGEEEPNKAAVVAKLFGILNNVKMSAKVRLRTLNIHSVSFVIVIASNFLSLVSGEGKSCPILGFSVHRGRVSSHQVNRSEIRGHGKGGKDLRTIFHTQSIEGD